MLTSQQAQAQLEQWRLPERTNRIVEGFERLPRELHAPVKELFGLREEDDSRDWQESQRARREATLFLDGLTEKKRGRLLELIAPQMAPAMEAAWQLLKTTPYQIGYARKAFRAPGSAETAADKLHSLLFQSTALLGQFPGELVTPAWLAAWSGHMRHGGSVAGVVLAAVLNESSAEGDEVFEILRLSLTNQHEIGGMAPHVYSALLLSNRSEGWELIEKTLLAAQRQEGLRQALLECVDESHPEAFRRMLRLILERDLMRFSSVVRAVDVWFGHMWAAASPGVVKKVLTQIVEFLEDDAARQRALAGQDAEAAYLALWCAATEDAPATIPMAQKLLASPSVELRYVAVAHLVNLQLPAAGQALVPAIDDADLRVAVFAAARAPDSSEDDEEEPLPEDDRFERIERLLARMPEKPHDLEPLVWPWTGMRVDRSQSAGLLLNVLGSLPPTRLIPHLPTMSSDCRYAAARAMMESKPLADAARDVMVGLAGDASADVRSVAFKALAEVTLSPAEAERLEDYLSRKAGDLRRGVLELLLRQKDPTALASATRLLAAKDKNRRLAGLELLRHMAADNRARAECRRLADTYCQQHRKLTKDEQAHLDEIATDYEAVPTLDNALGLMNPSERTPVVAPKNRRVKFVTPAATACLRALDDLVHEHRETTIIYETYGGPREELLGNVHWGFPSVNVKKPREDQLKKLPLADVWTGWFETRAKKLRDADGFELVRALLWCDVSSGLGEARETWSKKSKERRAVVHAILEHQVELRHDELIKELLRWLVYLSPPAGMTDYLLDAAETAFALVPPADVERMVKEKPERRMFNPYDTNPADWRDIHILGIWPEILSSCPRLSGEDLTPRQQVRRWQLLHWFDEPIAGAPRQRPDAEILFSAYDNQAANLNDVADQLLGPRGYDGYSDEHFGLLVRFTERKPGRMVRAWLASFPEVAGLVDTAVERILELELGRGDAPTAATAPAHAFGALWGIDALRRVLATLGKEPFKPEASWRQGSNLDRRYTLTSLAKVSYPRDDETPEDFVPVMKAAVKAGEFPEERLLQLTFLAPQWTKCVEAYLGWKHLSEGVYWFLAHMPYAWGRTEGAALAAGEEDDDELDDEDDDEPVGDWPPEKELSAWERLILERTPLSRQDRDEGAIDVGWFRETYKQIGPARWQALAAAARFAATPAQAKRAALIADVLAGKTSRKRLVDGIKKKYLKENVRLLGLLPLATGKKRDVDLRERCTILRDYRRYANGLSGLTKPAALRAWEIGMKNLALTAGLGDPVRLEWAVSADAVRDLVKGPVSVTSNDVTVTLSLDEESKPKIDVAKKGKPLKSIPPAVKKDKKIAELTARVPELKRQATAIRQALETLMCRGDTFSGSELRGWVEHALVAPLLSRLVIAGEGILGYPAKGGRALADHAGKLEPVKAGEKLRVAHPHDLLASGQWDAWQRECFLSERIQPFKQVFRELYVPTKQEKKDGNVSHRYDGQQIQPRQGMALFGTRGWNTDDGVFKVFHDAGLVAEVDFEFGFGTPAEVEGWTLSGVGFRSRDEFVPMKLVDVPPRIFSEAMRDLDLVVSVAHAGGVDPEASASTVEMRAALLRETCQLLNLSNVRLKPPHALVDGQLAEYSVHLGSGTVHRMPGGAMCIVPVHALQRGRLFLPFADDDPRTAEVVSKVLLLARDSEIQDPTILEQIRV